MASKRTKIKRHQNSWLHDIDELERKSKKTRKDDSKVKSNYGKQHQNVKVKAPAIGKERKTWNSRCGTDFGVFEQTGGNSGGIGMTEMEEEEEIQVIKEKLVKIPATVDIKQENSSDGIAMTEGTCSQIAEAQQMEGEEEIQVIKEKLVKTPASVDIKQENYSDEEEEIEIFYEDLVQTPTISNIKLEQSSYQPKVTFTLVNENVETVAQATDQRGLKNGQIRIRKDLEITSVGKQPAGTSAGKQPAGSSEFLSSSKQPLVLSKSPVNCEHLEGPPHVNTASAFTLFGSSASCSSSTGSSASNSFFTGSSGVTTGNIHNTATRSQRTSPIIVSEGITGHIHDGANGSFKSPTISKHHSGPLESLATSEQPPGTSDTSEIPVNSQHPEEPLYVNTAAHFPNAPSELTITSVFSLACNSFYTASSRETTETTRHIQERVNRSQGNSPVNEESEEVTGPFHDGTSQGNSLVNNESEVTEPLHDGTTQRNSLVNNESEVTEPLHDGTTQGNSLVNNESEVTEPLQDGTTQNSPVNNESEEVTGPLHDGAISQKTRSRGNLTIKMGSGDVTVTDGGRTVQMKVNDGSISGEADDVVNLVKTLKQVVYDL